MTVDHMVRIAAALSSRQESPRVRLEGWHVMYSDEISVTYGPQKLSGPDVNSLRGERPRGELVYKTRHVMLGHRCGTDSNGPKKEYAR